MPSRIINSSNSFRNQAAGEQTVLVSRRHWIVLLGPILAMAVFALMPFFVYHYVSQASWYGQWLGALCFAAAVYYFLLWDALFYNLMLYVLNTIVITDKRIIKNEQNGFFKYSSAELEIEKVQDVSVKVQGFWAAIFHFGDLEIQTAGTQNKFYFDRVPDPEKIKALITDIKTSS
ncbi:MAG: PH domain-containing protein [Candidatus Pacebacteria bacterium]|nr:PH domain-containing protein [Candidatus Paceibacterota bacterium]